MTGWLGTFQFPEQNGGQCEHRARNEEAYTQNLGHASAPFKTGNRPNVIHTAKVHSLYLLRIELLGRFDASFQYHSCGPVPFTAVLFFVIFGHGTIIRRRFSFGPI